jgi:hypothetical protein
MDTERNRSGEEIVPVLPDQYWMRIILADQIVG